MMGNIAIQRVIIEKQKQFDKVLLIDKSKERKFAVHYYKVWTFDANSNAYSIPALTTYDRPESSKLYIEYTVQEILSIAKNQKYFMKVIGEIHKRIQSVFDQYKEIKTQAKADGNPNLAKLPNGSIAVVNS